ncbi:aspartate aminotransferase family protein [Pleomorphochaeta sp. DL1XJH-081]|uniref:aspartate aminotransferase family protein n=1 Tax=Pleomorphochaeta sp. DL1XJH-081 TaxID=3409690 RepID=UPI003BB70B10
MDKTIELGKSVFMETYAQFPIVLAGGDGRYVFDTQGKRYLDLVAGIAVNILGYGDKRLSSALHKVIDNGLLHCSNLYWNSYAVTAASRLARLSSMEKVFFCNSGTEANEGAIKLVRKYGSSLKEGRTDIITMKQSFHGRTYASMTATGQTKYQKSFYPLVPGFSYAPFNDYDALKNMVTDTTCAIFIEPVQGEGGVVPADASYLKKVRQLCDDRDILLVFDEVQCGMGRTGKPFAWQKSGVKPDVMTLAKALGGGVPIGAVVATGKAATVLQPGDHAATFGGNLLATAAADCVLEVLEDGELLEHVEKVGSYLRNSLEALKERFSQIVEVRGAGLMLGVQMSIPIRPILDMCMKEGLILANAGPEILRFVPPLTITESEIDEAITILTRVLEKILD